MFYKKLIKLTKTDIPMVKEFETCGRQFLKNERLHLYSETKNEIDENEILVGFHCPPFNSQHHLHLHIVYPSSNLNRTQRGKVKNPGWFPINELIQSLEEFPDARDRFALLTNGKLNKK